MTEEPSLEAVTIDRTKQRISVATLGQADLPTLTRRISQRLAAAEAARQVSHCSLLEGRGQCDTCFEPLSAVERRRISIQHNGASTTIARVTCPTAPTLWRWRDIPWPKVLPRDLEVPETDEELGEWKMQLLAAILCGVFGLAAVWLAPPGPGSIGLWCAAYLAGGWFTAWEVWERVRDHGAIDVHFLMLAVAAGSASIGAWGEGATLLFLFSLSSALEHFALGRTQKEIRALFRNTPRSAIVLDADGHESELPVERLAPGMRLLVKPGAQYPADAEIIKGRTASDESNLTGEATPVDKAVGDQVFSGTINLWGAVEAVVLRPASESSLQKIIKLIREAQKQKAPAQQFTDRFSSYYTYAVLGLSLLMFFVWWLGFGQAPFAATQAGHSAFYHTMTLLVVASPCALVLSIPSAILAAIAWSARHGILFRGGAAVEKLAGITTVALDKTGTLTTGELRVKLVETFPAGRERELEQLAYSLEKLSTHPLARAFARYGKQKRLSLVHVDHFESIAGHGLRAGHNGTPCFLGRRDWVFQSIGKGSVATALIEPGCSEVWVAHGDLLGRIVLRDDIRSASRSVMLEIKRAGLNAIVLTGDRRSAAEHLRSELQIDDIRAELKPEDKLSIIQSLAQAGQLVAMVGDGVNDAPSLAAAHIGVAMGARGSDAALEQADVVLMNDRLENFLAAFRLSQRARQIIRQNLVISLGTVAVLVTFALLGRIPLTVGVVGHEGSTVIVVMNSLRLLFGAATPGTNSAPP